MENCKKIQLENYKMKKTINEVFAIDVVELDTFLNSQLGNQINGFVNIETKLKKKNDGAHLVTNLKIDGTSKLLNKVNDREFELSDNLVGMISPYINSLSYKSNVNNYGSTCTIHLNTAKVLRAVLESGYNYKIINVTISDDSENDYKIIVEKSVPESEDYDASVFDVEY